MTKYENLFDDLRERYEETDDVFKFTEDYKYQLIIDNLDPGTVLDVGCGVGMLEERLLPQRRDVLVDGVDISEESIEEAKRRACSCPVCRRRDLYRTANILSSGLFSRGSIYNNVVCTEVLEHLQLDDQIKLLYKVHHLLRLGGQLIVTVPNIFYLFNFIPYRWRKSRFRLASLIVAMRKGCIDQRHPAYSPHYYYWPWTLLRCLRTCNFKVEKVLSGTKWHNRVLYGILPKWQRKIAEKVTTNIWPFNWLGMQLVIVCRKR